jgi:hypothetical protein
MTHKTNEKHIAALRSQFTYVAAHNSDSASACSSTV